MSVDSARIIGKCGRNWAETRALAKAAAHVHFSVRIKIRSEDYPPFLRSCIEPLRSLLRKLHGDLQTFGLGAISVRIGAASDGHKLCAQLGCSCCS